MSKERQIRRSNQEVFFCRNQDHLQEPLNKIFQRCTDLFALAQNVFPETRMRRKKRHNLPTPGYSGEGNSFTFNFGLEDPRSIWIHGDRDYIQRSKSYHHYVDTFFRFGFELPRSEELLALIDRDRLTTHDPYFFVQRTDLKTFESGISWSLKEEYMEDGEPEYPRDPFLAPVLFLEKLFADINRPVTGINAIVVNLDNLNLLKEGSETSLLLSDLFYPETRRVDETPRS